MPAERKDGRSEADNASAGSPKIFSLQRCSPDRWVAIDRLSALCPAQNRAGRLRAYNLARTSECVIRLVCCSSSPIQKLASYSPAALGAQAAAVPLSTWGGCKAAGLMESEPGPRLLAEYCLT